MYREKVLGEKERRRDTDLKELAHVSVGLSESKALGEASRLETWGRGISGPKAVCWQSSLWLWGGQTLFY